RVGWDRSLPAHKPRTGDTSVIGASRDGVSPEGGNHVFGDGAGSWIDFRETRELQSHAGNRNMYYFQAELGDEIPPLP
ncbi:MAG: hypothetical protein ACPGYV_13175, partial [Phycisphaeraceae bacterium]